MQLRKRTVLFVLAVIFISACSLDPIEPVGLSSENGRQATEKRLAVVEMQQRQEELRVQYEVIGDSSYFFARGENTYKVFIDQAGLEQNLRVVLDPDQLVANLNWQHEKLEVVGFQQEDGVWRACAAWSVDKPWEESPILVSDSPVCSMEEN